MIKYKIKSISDRIIENKTICVMDIEIDSNEISSTGISIQFELSNTENISKTFIEKLIKIKIEKIRNIERIKKVKKSEIEVIRKKFIELEGNIQ